MGTFMVQHSPAYSARSAQNVAFGRYAVSDDRDKIKTIAEKLKSDHKISFSPDPKDKLTFEDKTPSMWGWLLPWNWALELWGLISNPVKKALKENDSKMQLFFVREGLSGDTGEIRGAADEWAKKTLEKVQKWSGDKFKPAASNAAGLARCYQKGDNFKDSDLDHKATDVTKWESIDKLNAREYADTNYTNKAVLAIELDKK